MKPEIIVIVGPTASGKTSLSIKLAKQKNGEIISADSMQIYKYMDIGTAKVTKDEMQGIPHYMIDIVSPNERFSVSDYVKQATECIEKILAKGKTPIVVGGTGLYIDSLIYGIKFSELKIDEEYREKLNKIAAEEGLENLYNMAVEIDPEAMKIISKNDRKRIIRILEIYKQTGKTKTQQNVESRLESVPYTYKVYGIDMKRDLLYERINKRVDIMLENGLIEEVKDILGKYNEFPTAMQGLGYKEVVEYLNGITTMEEMIEKLKKETRRYAKRQLTWFRKNKEITWIDPNEGDKTHEISGIL
ncbi:MAG: tRNA (adenosine(37)-N6)-dimethylallyltransferase MiaA [Lachnospiraceae bacterium]|jgi:tRNA dimethylallyltransferase|nr:tRNA (adenosine(37)-N6)-dimethylallyltransferase MiaA [Lachnospiraceae bacterium]